MSNPSLFARWVLAVLVVVASSVTGCSSEEAPPPGASPIDDEPPIFGGVDRTVACSADQIGWNFTTGGSSLADAQGTALSGIQVVTAGYGYQCGTVVDITGDMRANCNGENVCLYKPQASLSTVLWGSIPCTNTATVQYKCGAESSTRLAFSGIPLALDAASPSAPPLLLDCGPQMQIVSATYGANCGVAEGAHTAALKARCDATRNCEGVVDFPDPKFGCAKDFNAKWTCADTPGITYSKTLPSEAGGTKYFFGCGAEPKIAIKTAAWGANCGVSGSAHVDPLKGACEGKAACEYTVGTGIAGDPAFNCAKDYLATYTCGQDTSRVYTVYAAKEADKKRLQLSCVGATSTRPADSVTSEGRKACVPKTCAWNQRRDRDMKCVADSSKRLISGAEINQFGVSNWFNGLVPTQLEANVPYGISLSMKIIGPKDHVRMTPWLTRRFTNQSTGQVVEGFACTLPPMNFAKLLPETNLETIAASAWQNVLSPECYDARSNPGADAAKRLNLDERSFRQVHVENDWRLHFSIDAEGAYGFVKQAGVTPTAPNPPGFYYDQAKNYVDMVGFYQQRELSSYLLDYLHQPISGKKVSDTPFTLKSSPTVDVHLKDWKVTNGTAMTLGFFAPSNPSVNAEVNWALMGLWPANPFSQAELNRRNLRATIEIYPSGSSGQAMELGRIPLTSGSPTGTTSGASMIVSSALRDRMFGDWKNQSTFSVRACLDLDGASTRGAANTNIAGTSGYSLNVHNDFCREKANAITVTRDYVRRTITPDQPTANVGNTRSDDSGDSRSASDSDVGQEKSCTETGSGATMQQSCTSTRRADSTASGDFGQSLYSATTDSQRVESDTNVQAEVGMDAEALGFQVIDVGDQDESMTWDKTGSAYNTSNPVKISIEPNWDLILITLKAAKPPPPDWTKGRYGGRMGLGVGLGYKIPFLGVGLITLSVSVGVSIGIDFELQFKPESGNEYPCLNSTKTKCFASLQTQAPLLDASRACRAKGGRLAEMVTAADRAGIHGAAQANVPHWLGGQVGYEYPNNPECLYPSYPHCGAVAKQTLRWAGSDQTFFTLNTGVYPPVASFDATKTSALSSELTFASVAPTQAGLQFNGASRQISPAVYTASAYPVCEFDGAAKTGFSQWTVGLHLGAGAGVGVSVCIPSDEIGVCINGQLNAIDVSLVPTIGHRNFTLYDAAGTRFGTRGNTFVDIPYEVSLLTGAVTATVNFFFGSASWTLAEYKGFKVASGSIYHYDWPSREVFQ